MREEGVQHVRESTGGSEITRVDESLYSLKQTCKELSIPLAQGKQDSPMSVITVLGIIIDTDKRELRLPMEKWQRLVEEVQLWLRKKSCTRRN